MSKSATKYEAIINGNTYPLDKHPSLQNRSPVHISTMSGKLDGIFGITTSCLVNERCRARSMNPDSICHECYAQRYLDYRDNLENCAERNGTLLQSGILDWELLPKFKDWYPYIRIEPFGDTANATQAINYARIAINNPNHTFGWWTKNLDFMEQAFDAVGGKPDNIRVVYSSPIKNDVLRYEDVHAKYPFVDVVFSVVEKKFAEENGIEITCGGRQCLSCMKCYGHNDIHEVVEQKK